MKNYATWLQETQETLRAAVEEAEEAGWHHLEASPDTRTRISIYDRLLTWEREITERKETYDRKKSRR